VFQTSAAVALTSDSIRTRIHFRAPAFLHLLGVSPVCVLDDCDSAYDCDFGDDAAAVQRR
jgi:hypothetical protein